MPKLEDKTMPNWIGAHVRGFEFMGGVAELLIPDNTKTGVSKACRYEPDLNPTYQEMAMHYGLGVLPDRAGRGSSSASVEAGFLFVCV
jgi:transposase